MYYVYRVYIDVYYVYRVYIDVYYMYRVYVYYMYTVQGVQGDCGQGSEGEREVVPAGEGRAGGV